MMIRIEFSTILTLIAIALSFCAAAGFNSQKSIGKYVGWLELSLIPPIIGNMIIIGSDDRLRSFIGCHIFLLGMDCVMFSLVRFTDKYCQGIGDGTQKPTFMYAILFADAVQLLLNPVFGHAFDVECIEVEGLPYYRMVPYIGQTFHRIVDYLALIGVMLIFLIGTIKTVKLYRERYLMLLISMLIAGIWQGFYILSRQPIDSSMIGLGLTGILIFYFSLYYRPFRLLDRILSDVAADMDYALYVYDPAGRCIWANKRGMEFTDLGSDELDRVSERLCSLLGERGYERRDWDEDIVVGTGDSALYYSVQHRAVRDESSHIAGSFLVVRDTTEEQRSIKREIYDSTHDSLTGLYTKQHFYQCVRRALDDNPDTDYVSVFVDVKNFKIVNDIFSNEFGDEALIQIADWIRTSMTKDCVYGRLAGDTFGAFIPVRQFSAGKAEKKLSNFIIKHNNIEHRLLIHLGVYEVLDRHIPVSVMFDRAHLALSTIKDEYKIHIAYYDTRLREKVVWEQHIVAGLDKAIENMQLMPYLQPITDKTGKVVGAEALARWHHPEQGFMSPGSFIPVLEKNGMIVEVDRHMWRCACRLLSRYKDVDENFFISVNISPKDFYFIDVISELTGIVKEYDIEPQKLRIEITETIMMTDPEEKMNILAQLRSKGFIVEMDDFGSGYSSLSLLKDMPVDVLKIDMKFLYDTNSGRKAWTIVKNIINLSDELGISSLTEGVETKEQYDRLSQMGCRMFQGYFFAKPMPREEFEEFAFGHIIPADEQQ